MVGKLQTKDIGGDKIDYLESDVKMTCKRGDVDIPITITNGIFKGTVTIFKGANYKVKCRIVDTSSPSKFQYNEIGIIVPGDTQGSEVSAGIYLLTTKTGNFCSNGDNACWQAMKNTYGSVKVLANDVLDEMILSNIDVKLTKYWWPQTRQYALNNVSQGEANFKNVRYGCYTATINDKAYRRSSQRFCLQSSSITIDLNLIPVTTNSDYVLQMRVSDKNADMDFNLEVLSKDKTTSCTVSPLNKYCAYARHVKDQVKGSGKEIIELQNFSVSWYMAYISPSPNYQGTCPQAKMLKDTKKTYKFFANIERRELLT